MLQITQWRIWGGGGGGGGLRGGDAPHLQILSAFFGMLNVFFLPIIPF